MPRARIFRDSEGGGALAFDCPGCGHLHAVPVNVGGPRASREWEFNGSEDLPTLNPSLLVHEYRSKDGVIYQPKCHCIVTEGRVRFLDDCGHAFAGQTLDLPEWNAT